MQVLAPDLSVVTAPQCFLGLEVGARMTLLRLEGGLLVHSPVRLPPAEVAALGPIRWAVAPNLLHHLHIGPWIEAGAAGWAAPGLSAKRPELRFAGVLGETPAPFGAEVQVIPLRCFPLSSEVALLHRPSRTLILTDLVFNLPPTAPWATRLALACLGGYPGCRATALEWVGMDRALARVEIGALLALDFERLILAHGDIIEHGGREALAGAYRWLGL